MSTISGNVISGGVLTGTFFPAPSGGPSAEDVFSAHGVDELTIPGTGFTGVPNIKKYILSDETAIGESAFLKNLYVEEVEAPKATSVERTAFQNAQNLNKVTLPKVESIAQSCFYGTSSLKKIELPELTTITGDAFNLACVEELNIPKYTTILSNNFKSAKKLKKLTTGSNLATSTTSSSANAFYEMGKDVEKGSSEIELEVTIDSYRSNYFGNIFSYATVKSLTVKTLASYSGSNRDFQNIKAESISFPDLVSLTGSSNAFQGCNVDSISFPNLETLGSGSFKTMTFPADYDLTLPKVTAIPIATFMGTTGVNSITLPLCTEIKGSNNNTTFPSAMKELYLPGGTMCVLNGTPTNVFGSTFLSAEDTAVHVPSDLLASYTEATNWADMSTKLVGDLPAVG